MKTMKITLKGLKRLIIEEMTASEEELRRVIGGMSPDQMATDDFVDADTGEIYLEKGQPARTSTLHPQYEIDRQERRAAELAALEDELAASEDEEDSDKARVEADFQKAVDEFVDGWVGWRPENDDGEVSPETFASDAAVGFMLSQSPGRLGDWGWALDMTRDAMQEYVADLVHDAILRGR